jgi:hypothetical protein
MKSVVVLLTLLFLQNKKLSIHCIYAVTLTFKVKIVVSTIIIRGKIQLDFLQDFSMKTVAQ